MSSQILCFACRVWSKKYPIQIRTNTRKPRSSPETSRKMAASASQEDLKLSEETTPTTTADNVDNDEANFDEIMFDAREDLSESEESCSNLRLRKNATATNCDKKISPTNSNKTSPINSDKVDDVSSSFVIVPDEEVNKTYYLFTR